ncbi:MAG: type II toxin-antitoxin system RelE/ParE family toxin [Planctomycetaceae bacterium]
MPRVEKTSLAETDVVDIWVYIAQDDRDAATKMLRRIEDRLDSIAAMPLSAEAVPSLGCEMRRFSVGN